MGGTMKARLAVVAGCLVLFAGACASTPIQVPGEAVYRAFKQIGGATAIGVTKPRYDELLQNASAELLILADLAPDSVDAPTLRRYGEALEKYKDAGVLWAEQIDDARYDWIPKGRIYLESAAQDVASRYKLPTQTHKGPYAGGSFETVSSTSIQALWELAHADVRSADSIVVSRLRASLR
jgi:hypothetical protein